MVRLILNRLSVFQTNKKLLFLIVIFFGWKMAFAQEEMVHESVFVAGTWRTPYSYLDIEDYEMKLMFKVMQPTYSRYYGVSGGNISIEAKLTPSISVEGGYILPSYEFHTVFGRVRYYTKKGQVSNGVNNLIGSHFLVGIDKFFEQRKNDIIYHGNYYPNDLQISVGYGYQGKVGRYGVYNALAAINYGLDRKTAYGALKVEAGFGYGVTQSPQESPKNMGLAFLQARKMGFLKVSNMGFAWGDQQKGFGIELTYERSLWKDLTVEGVLNGSLGEVSYLLEHAPIKYRYSKLSADINLKYYHSRKKRFGLDKLSSPFSGPYILAGIMSTDENYMFADQDRKNNLFRRITYRAAWGYQQPIGKYGFIDFNAGPAFSSELGFDFISDLKIGLRF